MLKLLADENLDNDILRGLELKIPTLEIVRVQDVGLQEADDPDILDWAARNERILVSHDRKTMARFAYERVERGLKMPGVFLVRRFAPIGSVIDDLWILAECSREGEWEGQVRYLPLR